MKKTLATLTVLLGMALPSQAQKYDVSYIWHKDKDAIAEYKELISKYLGPKVTKELQIVQGNSGNYGLIYDRDGTKKQATYTAGRHTDILRRQGLDNATIIRDQGYEQLYHLSFSLGQNLKKLKQTYYDVATQAPELTKKLVITETDFGNKLIEHKEAYTFDEIKKRAEQYSTQLGREVSWTPARGNGTIYQEAEYLSDFAPIKQQEINIELGEKAKLTIELGNLQYVGKLKGTPIPKKTKVILENQPKTTEIQEEKPIIPITEKQQQIEQKTVKKIPQIQNIDDKIDQFIKQKKERNWRLRNTKTAWKIYDLTSETSIVDINEDEAWMTASEIKVFVALAYMHGALVDKKIPWNPENTTGPGTQAPDWMEDMLRNSDNKDTDRLMNWARHFYTGIPINSIQRHHSGYKTINDILKTHYSHIFKDGVIKENIRGGSVRRNKASVNDYFRLLKAIHEESVPGAAYIKQLMSLPKQNRHGGTVRIDDRVYDNVPEIPSGTRVYDKTGTTGHEVGNIALIEAYDKKGNSIPYIFVGSVYSPAKQNWIQFSRKAGNLIREVSGEIYTELKKHYELK